MGEVIAQLRAAGIKEFVVLSDAFGADGDPREEPSGEEAHLAEGWPIDRQSITALRDVAQKHGAGFLDLRQLWVDYIQTCGKPYSFFMRDLHHANHYGREVVARMLLTYFTA